ncbi:hypothetical protein [Fructilactobacillus florum]|uniref:Uncharacterized protein n=1 Tax=Fructilactobacillus florum DSM 22689 = JCM 16035 TaxID=1423745 RepID=A0A0R2CFC2_9LACO|nr:hypothetical protein [Fructilactobacillus florum]KRM89810.1 hypothetical protein FC87_GL000327 [Fructilactobacillus florum DSM 22689 = JCM 16035]
MDTLVKLHPELDFEFKVMTKGVRFIASKHALTINTSQSDHEQLKAMIAGIIKIKEMKEGN